VAGRDVVEFEHVEHGGAAAGVTQLAQLAVDPAVPPVLAVYSVRRVF